MNTITRPWLARASLKHTSVSFSYTPCMDNSGRMGQPPAEQAGGGEGESWTRSSNARPARMRRWKLVDSFGIESGGGAKLVGNTPHQTGGFQILHRLNGGGGIRKTEDLPPKPTPKVKADPKKGAGKGKRGGDVREAERGLVILAALRPSG